jgi:hypothetical protein
MNKLLIICISTIGIFNAIAQDTSKLNIDTLPNYQRKTGVFIKNGAISSQTIDLNTKQNVINHKKKKRRFCKKKKL